MLLGQLLLTVITTPLAIAIMSATSFASDVKEEQFRVPVTASGLKVLVRHLSPANRQPVKAGRVVLILHGGTLPSGASAAFRFDGHSWMDDLSDHGFDVWAMDYLGYGGSDRYPEMSAPASANPPVGRAAQVSSQVSAVVEFICKRQNVPKVSIISHSWGTLVAGVFATQEPARLDRLVLYGPVALRQPPVLEKRHFEKLGPTYIDSDPTSRSRTPASVQVPGGPDADAADAWTGKFIYDPSKIQSPTLIIRGEWETITTDQDAHWLYKALTNAPIKRDVLINRATHVMHLEKNRYQVYREVQSFLEGGDTLPD
jgi:pimeloyl-ACP methyl ester carboxylesterase